MEPFYLADGTPVKCWNCGAKTVTETVEAAIDVGVGGGGIPSEIRYTCAWCDTALAYWAHGSFDPSFVPKLEA